MRAASSLMDAHNHVISSVHFSPKVAKMKCSKPPYVCLAYCHWNYGSVRLLHSELGMRPMLSRHYSLVSCRGASGSDLRIRAEKVFFAQEAGE